MQNFKRTYYPTSFEAVHLLVLYIFMQSLVDFPLALYDYNHDTDYLSDPWIGFISSISITAFIFIFGYKNARNTFKQVFAIQSFNPFLLLPVLVLLPSLQYLVGFVNVGVEKILPAPPWFWELFERIFENHFGFFGTALKVVVIAPIIEEALFRGIIMHGLMRNYKPWYAIFLSGLLFSLFHLNPWQMSYTFFLGLLLGWIMVKTHSLPLAILVHAINNLIVLLSVTFPGAYAKTPFHNFSMFQNILIALLALLLSLAAIVWITTNSKKLKVERERT